MDSGLSERKKTSTLIRLAPPTSDGKSPGGNSWDIYNAFCTLITSHNEFLFSFMKIYLREIKGMMTMTNDPTLALHFNSLSQ